MKKIFICILVLSLFLPKLSGYAETYRGSIYIPCLKIEMPIFSTSENNGQGIIDNEKSALYTTWGRAYQIMDHAFSEDEKGNEWNIQKIFPGAYAYFNLDGEKYYLECYMTAKTNYIKGNEYLNNTLLTPHSSLDLMLVCCAENTSKHFIAVFRRL